MNFPFHHIATLENYHTKYCTLLRATYNHIQNFRFSHIWEEFGSEKRPCLVDGLSFFTIERKNALPPVSIMLINHFQFDNLWRNRNNPESESFWESIRFPCGDIQLNEDGKACVIMVIS